MLPLRSTAWRSTWWYTDDQWCELVGKALIAGRPVASVAVPETPILHPITFGEDVFGDRAVPIAERIERLFDLVDTVDAVPSWDAWVATQPLRQVLLAVALLLLEEVASRESP